MLIATYGTLRKGGSNYHVNEWSQATHKFTGKTKECYDLYAFCHAYPSVSLAHSEHKKQVVVDVYETETLGFYDNLEGYPVFYNRSVITVLDADGNEHEAYIYHIDRQQEVPILSGDWFDRSERGDTCC